jgi:hypothetical protein
VEALARRRRAAAPTKQALRLALGDGGVDGRRCSKHPPCLGMRERSIIAARRARPPK